MSNFKVEKYRSGYTEIDFVVGMVPRNMFKGEETYVLRHCNGVVMVYSILRTQQLTPPDLVRALGIQNLGGGFVYIVEPRVEFSGNMYKFFSNSRMAAPFLMVSTSDDHFNDSFAHFSHDGFVHNAYFNGIMIPPDDVIDAKDSTYAAFAHHFYRRLVLGEANNFYSNVIERGVPVTKQA